MIRVENESIYSLCFILSIVSQYLIQNEKVSKQIRS